MIREPLYESSFLSKTFVYRKPALIWKIVRIILYIYLGITFMVILLEGRFSFGEIIKPILPSLLILGASYSMANRSRLEKITLTLRLDEDRLQAIYGAQDVGDGESPKIRLCDIPLGSIKAYDYSIPLPCIRIEGDWVVREYDNTQSIAEAEPIRTIEPVSRPESAWQTYRAGTTFRTAGGSIEIFMFLEPTSADEIVDAITEACGRNPKYFQTPFLPLLDTDSAS